MIIENDTKPRRKTAPTQNTSLGKLPPQARDLEEAVLGALLLEYTKIPISIWNRIRSEFFYVESHQKIYQAIFDLKLSKTPIDILTVTQQLRGKGELELIGGAYYITELTNRVSSSANIDFHINIIHQKFLQRELIRIGMHACNTSYDDTSDPFEMMATIVTEIDRLKRDIFKRTEKKIDELLREAKIERRRAKPKGLLGYSTGKVGLDKITQGDQPGQLRIKAARPAMGKCLSKGTKVIMYDGTLKNVEDIKAGDQLMGDDSKPRNVLSITNGQEQMYWVRQNKGIDYRVNESHILSLKYSGTQGEIKHGDVVNIGIKDFLLKSDKFKTRAKGYKVGIKFKEQPLEIDPYFLGVWLGDGCHYDSSICNPDIEIHEYLKEFSCKNNVDFSIKNYRLGDCDTVKLLKRKGKTNPITQVLRNIGVYRNKHIPHNFIFNSRENRLQILAGLIDTDGNYQEKENVFVISQVRKELSEQIKYLCHTLGFACTMSWNKKTIKSTGFSGIYSKITITGDLEQIPTKIKRKQARKSKNNRNVLVTGIKVEKDIVDDYYGFTIDGNHLFLLEDTTVTHNTADMCSEIVSCVYDYENNRFKPENEQVPVGCFSLEMSGMQLSYRMLSNVSQVNNTSIKKNILTDQENERVDYYDDLLSATPIYVDDTPGLTIDEFETKAAIWVANYGVRKIYIDYLQLMGGAKGKKYANREAIVSDISRRLKICAQELGITIVALCQLSRAVESRKWCKPVLSDLRESGSIEQDADVVEFLWRPEYYPEVMAELNNEDSKKPVINGLGFDLFNLTISDYKGLLVTIVAKCREEETGMVPLKFKGHIMRVSDHQFVIDSLKGEMQFTPNSRDEEPVF